MRLHRGCVEEQGGFPIVHDPGTAEPQGLYSQNVLTAIPRLGTLAQPMVSMQPKLLLRVNNLLAYVRADAKS